ncbi:OmpA family protein [Hydrogenophaga sp.]|uniref:OmpA family protein n=1 Tax=Hydrogenophaga sp. TaxID=1904254 RepID=UPI0025C6A5FF|nr:OmpA family protein [Hydrogenophaga sp.]
MRLNNAGGTAFTNYRLTENVPPGATLVSVSGASGFAGPMSGPGTLNLTVPTVPAAGVAVVTVQFQVAAQLPGGITALPNVISGGDLSPLCASACAVSIPVGNPVALGLIKSAAVREVRVGDLVRYSIRVSNLGAAAVSGLSVVDTPAPGFSYVAGSMSVSDADGAFNLGAGQSPLHIGGIDIAAGGEAVISYLLRVGAGVRQGVHTNRAQAQNSLGQPLSGIASAQVQVVGDPLLDEALLLGTVFDDRDGDGWQDPAHLSGVKVQGGFAPGVYLAGSTTLDRGQGPQPVADASAPLLHGMNLGSMSARQSQADPAESHQLVVRQRLSDLAFTDDFVLTSDQGVTVRMNAAGQTTTERSGEAAKGLNAAAPSVERRLSKVEGGYEIAYVVRNHGIDERGIPGVRIATVEGLLIESDPFGRFHLTGIGGGDAARGRNFILKIDPTTLPDGATLTTPNPLVRRVTPGLPARFDFGVKLPVQVLSGRELVEVELGEVLFDPGSATIRQQHGAVIEKMVGKVQAYGGGELVIRADGESAALALGRARALDEAMSSRLTPEVARATRVAVRAEMNDPDSLVVGVGVGGVVLGTVLFDTDRSEIRPVYRPMLADVARQLAALQGGVVALVGHADRRASDAYNMALGLRRAQALYQALVAELPPETRAKVRVDILPNAPHGPRPGQAAGPTP